MLKYYKKQEVNNTNLVNLKSNVNKVFEESGLSAKVTRRASQDDCRRSIYLYIVTYIRDTM
jgi:hypothetical protein